SLRSPGTFCRSGPFLSPHHSRDRTWIRGGPHTAGAKTRRQGDSETWRRCVLLVSLSPCLLVCSSTLHVVCSMALLPGRPTGLPSRFCPARSGCLGGRNGP